MKIAIIGGGASGMAAAVWAARSGTEVTILEQHERLGKKLLATGNGKCNYTNIDLEPRHFHLKENALAFQVIQGFDSTSIRNFFSELGIVPYARDGYVYPNSEQASSIADALIMELKRLHVQMYTEYTVVQVEKKLEKFCITAHQRSFSKNKIQKGKDKNAAQREIPAKRDISVFRQDFDRVIVATGTKASINRGEGETALHIAKAFGLQYREFLPALCALYCDEAEFFKQCSGVRIKARLKLKTEKTEYIESGELQLTEYGISGIPTFQLSRYVSKSRGKGQTEPRAEIDFLPNISEKEKFLLARMQNPVFSDLNSLGNGVLPAKLWLALLKSAKLSEHQLLGRLNAEQKKAMSKQLADAIQNQRFCIQHCANVSKAQVCTGGIELKEIHFPSMEARKVSGLFFCGEALDVDAMCGGYNLSWAWASGYFAGSYAAKKK